MTTQTQEKSIVAQTKPEADNQLAIARDKANTGLIQATLNKDWKGVKDEFRVRFVARLCEQLNIAPVLNPFRFIDMKGATVLYADKRAAALIANANKVSTEIMKEVWDKEKQIFKVYVRASRPDGSFSDEFASLHISSKSGQDRANEEMKCLTKAKRRAILALVDLAIPTEDELQYVNDAQQVTPAPQRIEAKSNVVDTTPEDERIEAMSELFEVVTGGDGKKMDLFHKFVADQTQGKKPNELTYDECHELMETWNKIKASAPIPDASKGEQSPLFADETNPVL